ncbi:MAG: glucose 1-dehydrogenase [Chloroflexi bacterium]|nr:glucose 1-dehydrogenase [Chloroflexota bacterium]
MADFQLAGRVAMVTGASRGIGRGIALELARAGAAVAVTARNLADLNDTVREIEAAGSRALQVTLEVRDRSSIRAAVPAVEERLGPIDVLVNNAGVQRLRLALDMAEEDWDCVLDVNLNGLFFCCQEVGRRMVDRRRGKIINVSSAAGLIASPERVAYASSKAAVLMLTRVLALEWAAYGVTVNAVAPTFVETELGALTLDRPGAREAIVSRIPLGRLATVEDVAAAVRYLASPAANFVTGTTIGVDGGLVLR